MAKQPKRASATKKPANRQLKRRGGNPNPPEPPKEYRFKPGQSGNPSGRPKLLGESYKEWLGKVNQEGITNAEAVAMAMGLQALRGEVGAAREIRSATEGDKVHLETWQSEIAEQIKAGALKPEEVIAELGEDDARSILIAAGQVVLPRASTEKT